MRLRDVPNVIRGTTDIRIYAGCLSIFHGKMCDANESMNPVGVANMRRIVHRNEWTEVK